ncbi:hypothetical protein B9Z55_017163 [Caenorhabditis nigoni]|nr:hypothetical protein B9Z55_017163 [Caenorhabditis nigoni]
MIGVVSISLVEMRSYLAVVIAIERVLATVFPIKFWKYRKGSANIAIVGFVLTTGCSVPIVMFYICELRLSSIIGCNNNICAYPPAYLTYRFLSTIIFSSFNAFFSGILCLKLFCLILKRTDVSTDLRRANLISLTDELSSLVFEILPSLISSALGVTNVGPALGVSRQLARAVEATVMAKLMG